MIFSGNGRNDTDAIKTLMCHESNECKHTNIVFWFSICGFSDRTYTCIHVHETTEVCEGCLRRRMRDIFYLASYFQRHLLSYYRSSLTRTENKCLFLPHLWELSFPEQNAVIIPDLPSVHRTRASATVWKVKCVCVREREGYEGQKESERDCERERSVIEDGMIHCGQKLVCDGTAPLGCAGIQVGESEEGWRANRRLLNEQYINYLKRHHSIFSLWCLKGNFPQLSVNKGRIKWVALSLLKVLFYFSKWVFINSVVWMKSELHSYNNMRPACGWHGNPF